MLAKANTLIPVLSIGMPVYNGEKYIREAIDSILAQTLTNFELIISDNASVDGTAIICEAYAKIDKRIRYIRQQENIGAFANFKFVLDNAQGKYFKWQSSDDYVSSDEYLSALVEKLENGNDYCFSAIETIFEDTQDKVINHNLMERFLSCESTFSFSKQTVFICSFQIYGAYKTSILVDNFRYISECSRFRCFGEGLFVHAMAARYQAVYVPSVKLVYRRHKKNLSSTVDTKHMLVDFFRFSRRLIAFYMGKEINYDKQQRIVILLLISYVHGKYLLQLLVKYVWRIFTKNLVLQRICQTTSK